MLMAMARPKQSFRDNNNNNKNSEYKYEKDGKHTKIFIRNSDPFFFFFCSITIDLPFELVCATICSFYWTPARALSRSTKLFSTHWLFFSTRHVQAICSTLECFFYSHSNNTRLPRLCHFVLVCYTECRALFNNTERKKHDGRLIAKILRLNQMLLFYLVITWMLLLI